MKNEHSIDDVADLDTARAYSQWLDRELSAWERTYDTAEVA